jgi:hypothetical protein
MKTLVLFVVIGLLSLGFRAFGRWPTGEEGKWEAGVAVLEGVTVKVVENTESHFHLVLPPKPTGELSDEALDKVAGGGGGHFMRLTKALPDLPGR